MYSHRNYQKYTEINLINTIVLETMGIKSEQNGFINLINLLI